MPHPGMAVIVVGGAATTWLAAALKGWTDARTVVDVGPVVRRRADDAAVLVRTSTAVLYGASGESLSSG